MSFSASQKDINEILSRSTIYYIPKNQRKYVWGVEEWNELFEDIFLIEQAPNYHHFLGSVVLAKEASNDEYSIIDGQQRLITLSILILAISNHLFRLGDNNVSKSYINTFLKVNKDGEENYKIERKDGLFFLTSLIEEIHFYRTNDEIREFFGNMYLKSDKYNEKLLDCYLNYSDRVESLLSSTEKKKEKLIELKNRITNCEIIEIIVEKDVDGFRVFETLNARGIPLEQHELIKNYLYSYSRSKTKTQRVDSAWSKILSNLTSDKIDSFSSFISHYCTHIYGKTKKNEEFKEIRAKTPKTKVDDLLLSLLKNSTYYSYILNPSRLKDTKYYHEEIYISLKYFKDLNIRQVRPLLLSLFEKYDEGIIDLNNFKTCVVCLETFYFMFSTILKNTTNTIDNSIVSLSKSIHLSNDNSVISRIKTELSKYVTEKEKMKECFKYIGFSNKNKKFRNSSNKRIINYIFTKFENYYDENNEIEPQITSIEHIICDSETNDVTSYIGNLLPMSSKINNRMADKQFSEKINWYKKSKLLSVGEFLSQNSKKTEWNANDIVLRGEKLAEVAFDRVWIF